DHYRALGTSPAHGDRLGFAAVRGAGRGWTRNAGGHRHPARPRDDHPVHRGALRGEPGLNQGDLPPAQGRTILPDGDQGVEFMTAIADVSLSVVPVPEVRVPVGRRRVIGALT